MREILFRGKRMDGKGWVEGGIVLRANGQIFIAPIVDASQIIISAVDPDTVGQYTGLTDKNGNPIFEGDVIRFSLKSGTTDYAVEWYNGGFVYRDVKIRATGSDLVQSDADNAEIVGNIHDRR